MKLIKKFLNSGKVYIVNNPKYNVIKPKLVKENLEAISLGGGSHGNPSKTAEYAKQQYIDYLNSPEYRLHLINAGLNSDEEINNLVKEANNTYFTTMNNNYFANRDYPFGTGSIPFAVTKRTIDDTGNIIVYNNELYNPDPYGTIFHEYGHTGWNGLSDAAKIYNEQYTKGYMILDPYIQDNEARVRALVLNNYKRLHPELVGNNWDYFLKHTKLRLAKLLMKVFKGNTHALGNYLDHVVLNDSAQDLPEITYTI